MIIKISSSRCITLCAVGTMMILQPTLATQPTATHMLGITTVASLSLQCCNASTLRRRLPHNGRRGRHRTAKAGPKQEPQPLPKTERLLTQAEFEARQNERWERQKGTDAKAVAKQTAPAPERIIEGQKRADKAGGRRRRAVKRSSRRPLPKAKSQDIPRNNGSEPGLPSDRNQTTGSNARSTMSTTQTSKCCSPLRAVIAALCGWYTWRGLKLNLSSQQIDSVGSLIRKLQSHPKVVEKLRIIPVDESPKIDIDKVCDSDYLLTEDFLQGRKQLRDEIGSNAANEMIAHLIRECQDTS